MGRNPSGRLRRVNLCPSFTKMNACGRPSRNPVPIIAFAKFDEVQQYLSLTNHIITPYVWFMNKDFYDGLTPEDQYVVNYAARAAVDSGRGISRMVEASDRGLPQLAKKMKINSVSAAELKKFADASQPAR